MASAKTPIANIEERLRRALSMVGQIGTVFDPAAMTPVVIADDAQAPGNNILRGRRFIVGSSTNASTSQLTFGMRATSEVVIERIIIGGYLSSPLAARLYVADDSVADPWTMATTVPWSENPRTQTDLAPIVYGASTTVNASAGGGVVVGGVLFGIYNPVTVIETEWHLQEGWKIYIGPVSGSISGTMTVTAMGYAR